MGLISSGDEFCARSDRALADIPGVFKLVDDILVHGENYAELLELIKMVFAQCEEYGITLSKDKYQFGPVVKFAGYVSQEGSKMIPDLVVAISNFPAPKDITNLRSLIGLVNRFNDQNPDLKHAMATWQLLLKKSNKFVWDEVHERALDKVKEIITNPAGPILRHFDSTLPIRLLTDASRSGIGLSLFTFIFSCITYVSEARPNKRYRFLSIHNPTHYSQTSSRTLTHNPMADGPHDTTHHRQTITPSTALARLTEATNRIKLLTRRSVSRDGLWDITGSALKTLRNQFNSRLCILRRL
jgi:hypothetical protein